jgi:hypothetical protein
VLRPACLWGTLAATQPATYITYATHPIADWPPELLDMPQGATIWAQPRAPAPPGTSPGGGGAERPSYKGRTSAALVLPGADSDAQEQELQGSGATGAYGYGPASGSLYPGTTDDEGISSRPTASRRFMGWLLKPQGQSPGPTSLFSAPSLPYPSPGGSTRVSYSGAVVGAGTGVASGRNGVGPQQECDIEAGVSQQQQPRLSNPGLSLARLLSLTPPNTEDGLPDADPATGQQQHGHTKDRRQPLGAHWLGQQSAEEGESDSAAETGTSRSRYSLWGLALQCSAFPSSSATAPHTVLPEIQLHVIHMLQPACQVHLCINVTAASCLVPAISLCLSLLCRAGSLPLPSTNLLQDAILEASFTDGSGIANLAADVARAQGDTCELHAAGQPLPHTTSSARRSWAFDKGRGSRNTKKAFKAGSQRMLPAPSLPLPTYSNAQFHDVGGRLVPRMHGTTMLVRPQ